MTEVADAPATRPLEPTPSPPQALSPHVLVWVAWVLAALVMSQAVTTPPVVLLLIGVASLLVRTCAQHRELARAFPVLIAAASCFALLRVVLTVLTTHGGTDVLATLPAVRLPALLGGFTVGGTLHRAILLRSISEGLIVVGVIACLAAFNAVVSHHELLRLLPRAFHELALVVTVALAFVPSTLATVTAVREAEHARTGTPGHARRGWPRRLGAVLESALERAVRLSESMESRGFGHGGSGAAERRGSRLALLAVVCCSGAFGALVARRPGLALALGVMGAALLMCAVATVSRARPAGLPGRRPNRRDVGMLVLLAVAALAAVALGASGNDARWDVATQPWPPMPPAALPLLALLAAPAVQALGRRAPA